MLFGVVVHSLAVHHKVLSPDYLPVQVHSLAVYHKVLTVVYLPVQVHSLAVHHEVLTVDYLSVQAHSLAVHNELLTDGLTELANKCSSALGSPPSGDVLTMADWACNC